jgi:hypothetical protein
MSNITKPLQNIHRIDIVPTGQHGWQVRSRIDNHDRSKWFGDKQYGGTAFALHQAVTYRDVMIDVLNK